MMMAIQVRYVGQVQGVGFRRRVETLAKALPVSGYVRNLTDGSVELLCEGEAGAVRDLLDQVKMRMQREIVEIQEHPAAVTGHAGFVIRR